MSKSAAVVHCDEATKIRAVPNVVGVISSRTLTCSAAVFHVSQSAEQENKPGAPTHDGYGPNIGDLFASFDRATSLWRTSQGCLIGNSETFLGTWPRSGLMRNGQSFHSALWVLHTHEPACSYWPTPRETMSRIRVSALTRTNGFKDGGPNLEEMVAARGERGGYLNPRWIEWLMGFPDGWCSLHLADLETQSRQLSRSGSRSGSKKRKG